MPGQYRSRYTREAYDPAPDTWASRAPMPTARYGLALAAASNGKLYAAGGFNGSGTFYNRVEEYDPASNSWATRTGMPAARIGLGRAAASNGKLSAVGGSNTTGRLSRVDEYNPATDSWTPRAPMPTARDGLGLVTGGLEGGLEAELRHHRKGSTDRP